MRERLADAMWLIWRAGYPLMIYSLIHGAVAVVMQAAGLSPYGEDAVAGTAAAALIAVVPLGMLYRRACRIVPQKRQWKLSGCLWTAVTGIGSCFFVNNLIILTGLTSEAYEEANKLLYQPPFGIQIVAIGILIPVAEELVFRGLGYSRMRWSLPFAGAAFVSAAYFAWYHGNLVQGVYAGCLGLLLAGAYEAYHSLWAPVCLHVAANLSSLLFTELVPDEMQPPLMPVILVSGAVMMFGIYKMREDVKKREVTVNCNPLL